MTISSNVNFKSHINHISASYREKFLAARKAVVDGDVNLFSDILRDFSESKDIRLARATLSGSLAPLQEIVDELGIRSIIGGLVTVVGAVIFAESMMLLGAIVMVIGICMILGPALRKALTEVANMISEVLEREFSFK